MKQNITFQLLILFGVIILSSVFARSALSETDLFIKIGDLSGGSLDPQHVGWCDGADYHYSSQTIDNQSLCVYGGCLEGFTFNKLVDQTSPDLYVYATDGQIIPEVRLQFYNVDGESRSLVYEIVLTNCCVKKIRTFLTGTLHYDCHEDTVELSFTEIIWKYFVSDGSQIVRSNSVETCGPCPCQ